MNDKNATVERWALAQRCCEKEFSGEIRFRSQLRPGGEVLHLLLFTLFALGVIGLQRGTTQNVLTTAAGATAQTGSVFAIPQDWSPSDEIAYQINITGGAFSALAVNFFFSLDGVNFPAAAQYQDNTHLNNTNVIEIGSAAVVAKAPFLQVSISGGVVSSGSPVVTVSVWPR